MQKMTFLLMLLCISVTNYAQHSKIFELPPNSITRTYFADLGKGNKMQIDLTDITGLKYLQNPDSLIRNFLRDMEPFKDSVQDHLTIKHIVYLPEHAGSNKLLIIQHAPPPAYLVKHGEAAALKLEQDTITFIGKVVEDGSFKKINDPSYYRIVFYLNDLNELSGYLGGLLAQNINDLRNGTKWVQGTDKMMHLKNNMNIYAAAKGGMVMGEIFLDLQFSANIQNYKDHFIPSLSVGIKVVTNHKNIRQEFGIYSESLFSFAQSSSPSPSPSPQNTVNTRQTFRNTIYSFSYGRYRVKEDGKVLPAFLFPLSVGFLVNRKGDLFEKGTIRFGFGEARFFGGKTVLEPLIYTNTSSLFNIVSPGIRLVQSF